MTDEFDPYHKWLGIPPKDQPPNHYRLLGLERFESDSDVIDAAAFRQAGHVRTYRAGSHSDLSQRLLAEISAARVCLLNPDTKAEYDASLRAAMAELPVIVPPPRTSVAEPPVASLSVPVVSAGVAAGMESTHGRARRRRATKSPVVELAKIVLGGIGGLVIAYCLLRFGFQIDFLDRLFRRTPSLSTSPRAEGDVVPSSQPVPVDFTGTGAGGPIVIRDRYEVDSIKTALSQSAASGATALSVATPRGFHPEDEILIIQMRGANAGQYEFQRVTSVGVDSLGLASALVNGYDASERIAVQRVPNFTDVTVEAGGKLTASAWNGVTGGMVAFRASGVVHIKSGGSIHADHLGFRGGTATMTGSHADGRQGESPLGPGVQGNRDANGGGGGAGNYASRGGQAFADWGCGGGGGGYGSAGRNGTGTNGFGFGGATYGTADLSRLMLGSGGGSGGSDDDGPGTSSGGPGGAGGGIVFIAARSLVLAGSLSANGADGQNAVNKQGEDESGGGGGGSGGSVLLNLATPTSPADIRPAVRGGTGGAGFCRGGDGGDGITRGTLAGSSKQVR